MDDAKALPTIGATGHGLEHEDSDGAGRIAIIGMAGLFPGAPDIDSFWTLLRQGRDGLIPASVEQGTSGPVLPVNQTFKDDPEFVSQVYGLADKARFDAAFFGISPREAELMDPQHRLFLETAWTALEHACVVPDETTVPVGVYAACGFNAYLFNNLPGVLSASSPMSRYLEVLIGNDKDYLATRTSYKLRLTGPSMVVQTACSSSLTAVMLACQGLRDYQCDMALAGGSSIQINQDGGYLPEDGSPLSRQGTTRTFDAMADGVAGGSGCAAVVLKRYEDALADGDVIYGVILGYGLNNDGADKVNFTAPSVSGQARAIAEAIAEAGIAPDELGYIECHGTGTALGDPIEITALNKALGLGSRAGTKIPVGSVKSNVGHLDTAAGVAALIKATLALHHEEIPPSLNFTAPNPKIDFAATPFEVCAARRPWPRSSRPRYAGVSSFGFGGTNTHLILGEGTPRPVPVTRTTTPVILPLSARDETGVSRAGHRLADTCEQVGLDRLAAVLQCHRKRFTHRGALVASSTEEARSLLDSGTFVRGIAGEGKRRLVFMFPGQGCQYPDMARDLYDQGGVFAETLDRLFATALHDHGHDIRPVLFPCAEALDTARAAIDRTETTHLAVFMVEYALGRQLLAWGIVPDAVMGHSLGEYAAACLANVMDETGALGLVARRGALSASLTFDGAMISLPLSRAALAPHLTGDLEVAVENGPERLTLTGPRPAVEALDATLRGHGIEARILRISNAFHCRVLDPILDDFRQAAKGVRLSPPTLPLLSNASGTYADPADIVTPDYWVRQFREAVLFSANLETVTAGSPDDGTVLVEVGPGTTLTSLARQHPVVRQRGTPCINLLPDASGHAAGTTATAAILEAVARLWVLGVEPDWTKLPGAPTGKAGLPGYPFAGERYWHQPALSAGPVPDDAAERTSIDDWFMVPSWVRAPEPQPAQPNGTWLVLAAAGSEEAAEELSQKIQSSGCTVVMAIPGMSFAETAPLRFTLRPGADDDMAALVETLSRTGLTPTAIVSLWPLELPEATTGLEEKRLKQARDLGLAPTVSLMRHLAAAGVEAVRFTLVARHMFDVSGEAPDPASAMLAAPLLSAVWEHPGFTGAVLDIGSTPLGASSAARLLAECLRVDEVKVARNGQGQARAWRNGTRWVRDYVPLDAPAQTHDTPALSGPCLITGGMGGIGLAYARLLAERGASPIILVGRTALPPQESWVRTEDGSITASLLAIQQDTGATIVPEALDCTDAPGMATLIETVQQEYGPLCGVVHAAGVPGGGMIASGLPEGEASNFHAKVGGMAALDQALASTALRFFHLTSSIGAIQGAIGQTDNCAANLVLDSFATWARFNRPWAITSINWDRWQGVGMAQSVETRHQAVTGHNLRSAMRQDDATEAASRLLGHTAVQVLVGNRNPFALARALLDDRLAATSRPSASLSQTLHARPALGVPYRAPGTETERLLVDLWSLSLGVSNIGINDEFMHLGGDSLLAIALMGRTRKTLRMQIPLRALFDTKTIARFAAWIAEHETTPGQAEKIAAAVRKIREKAASSAHTAAVRAAE